MKCYIMKRRKILYSFFILTQINITDAYAAGFKELFDNDKHPGLREFIYSDGINTKEDAENYAKLNMAITNKKSRPNLNKWHQEIDRHSLNVALIAPNLANISDEDIQRLATLHPNIKRLDFAGCVNKVTDENLERWLRHFPNITSINFSCCFSVTDVSVFQIAINCPNLKELNISYNSKITDKSVVALADACPYLEKFDIAYCRNITDVSLLAIARNCSNLKELDVWKDYEGSEDITDVSIVALADNCHDLEKLIIGSCSNITDVSIVALSRGCPLLRELHVFHSKKIIDHSIMSLFEKCLLLSDLNIEFCERINPALILAAASDSSILKKLNIEGCGLNITENAVLRVPIKVNPNLEELKIGSEGLWFSDAFFQALVMQHPNLKKLYISNGDFHITDASAMTLSGCLKLARLTFVGCDKITNTSISKIQEKNPKLEIKTYACKLINTKSSMVIIDDENDEHMPIAWFAMTY